MPRRKRIVRNAAKCGLCHDVIESKARNELVRCKCANLFVHGGPFYARIGWTPNRDNSGSEVWDNKTQGWISFDSYLKAGREDYVQTAATVSAATEIDRESPLGKAIGVIGSLDSFASKAQLPLKKIIPAKVRVRRTPTRTRIAANIEATKTSSKRRIVSSPENGKKTNLVSWFNPQDKKHLMAYQHLQSSGMWPSGFLPGNVEIPVLWNVALLQKMADAWMDLMSKEQ